ncbi:hypothetical protein HNP60_001269 [Sphingobium sp. B1D3A]|uniref:HNH endonuclease 5 domain-containing protein n=2 Tax=Sphingobium lignivorans TaxID=2735886 RepID=A0ABR6NDE4_9SPHN|nr:hypothetical protein [Sphingobium lignivorans]
MARTKGNTQHRKLCSFCGNGTATKEHIWPRWAAQLLPDDASHYRTAFAGKALSPTELLSHKEAQGGVKTITIRTVCQKCNGGWMSQLEEAVRPWLEPMLKHEDVTITDIGKRLLAQYFTMKAMTADQNMAPHAFLQKERREFYETRKVPDEIEVALLHYPGPANPMVGMFNKERQGYILDAAGKPVLSENGEKHYNMNVTFRYGSAFIQILILRSATSTSLATDLPFRRILHPPLDGNINWPPPPLDTRNAYGIQHFLERLPHRG